MSHYCWVAHFHSVVLSVVVCRDDSDMGKRSERYECARGIGGAVDGMKLGECMRAVLDEQPLPSGIVIERWQLSPIVPLTGDALRAALSGP